MLWILQAVKEMELPSCSMLPRFLAAGLPCSTPDTPLIVDVLLPARGSGLPEPGAGWAASTCARTHHISIPIKSVCAMGRSWPLSHPE